MTRAEGSIFLRDKKERRSLRGFGGYDATRLEIFFNKGVTSFSFSWVERVDFGYFWHKRGFQVDDMVIGSMWREGVEGFFREDVLVVFAPGGEFFFLGSILLGKLSREGDLIDSEGAVGRDGDSLCLPINAWVPFLEPRCAQDDLFLSQCSDFKFFKV